MADASSSGSGACTAVETAAAQLEARERLVSKSLKSSREKLWVQSQAFAERSRIRTARGDHAGALRDAKRALALFPNRVEYLIRVSEAHVDCGHPEQAYKAVEKAKSVMNAAGKDGVDVDSCLSLQRLEKLLRPFDHLPNEVVVAIFEFIYVDWERLPSPFQLCHVCTSWRKVAFATPTLWRDTRILRVAIRMATLSEELFHPVSRPPLFPHEAFASATSSLHPRTVNHIRLIKLCDSLSLSTLSHFEFHTLELAPDLARQMFEPALRSSATIRSISVVNKDDSVSDAEDGVASRSLSLVLRCPNLVRLELCTGVMSLQDGNELEQEMTTQFPATLASLRIVSLESADCYNLWRLPLTRQAFLLRASKTQHLTLIGISRANDEPEHHHFVGALLLSCATSLEELSATASLNVFNVARQAGLNAFPRLKRLRHVAQESDFDAVAPAPVIELPKLETVEAPIHILSLFAKMPARVVLQVFKHRECKAIAEWLLSFNDDEGPQHLRIELVCPVTDTELNEIIDAMTPSVAAKVACPRLATLSIVRKDFLLREGIDDHVFSLDFVTLRKPMSRDQWEDFVDASKVVRLEAERRQASLGLPLDEDPSARGSSFSRSAASAPSSPDDRSTEVTTSLPKCEALRSVTVESCFLRPAAWAAMKASPCEFKATPDPDEMSELPWEEAQQGRLLEDRKVRIVR